MSLYGERYSREVIEALEKAQRALEKAKKEESSHKMYVWTRCKGGLSIHWNTKEGLEKAVKESGYDWNEGTLGE